MAVLMFSSSMEGMSVYFSRKRISWARMPLAVMERICLAASRSKSTSHSQDTSAPSWALSLMAMMRSFSVSSSKDHRQVLIEPGGGSWPGSRTPDSHR